MTRLLLCLSSPLWLFLIQACGSGNEEQRVSIPAETGPGPSFELPREAARYVMAPPGQDVPPVAAWIEGGRDVTGELLHRDGRGCSIEGITPARRRLVIDFGRTVSGRLKLAIISSTAPRVHIALSESLAFLDRDGDAVYGELLSFPHLHRVPPEPGEWTDPLIRGGFRYAAISLDTPGRLEIDSVRCVFTSYLGTPETFQGYFLCSDDLLNRIWYAGVYTNQLCTLPPKLGDALGFMDLAPGARWVIADGAKRDRAVWTGDLYLESWIHLVSDYALDAIKDSLDSLAGAQSASGYIPACSPVLWWRLSGLGFDDYTAWWVLTLSLYYRYTGDHSYLLSRFETVTRALEYLASSLDEHHLFSMPPWTRTWCYSVQRSGEVSYINALLVWCFREASDLARAVGDSGREAHCRRIAQGIREAMLARLWDDARGVFPESNGDMRRVPLDANAIAIVGGTITRAQDQERALDYIFARMWSPWGSLTVDVPYPGARPEYHNRRVWPWMVALEVWARLLAGGGDDYALDLTRRTWGHFLEHDPSSTFWEWVGPDGNPETPYTSLCHGVSAGVVPILSTHVAGIEPTSPGFRTYRIRPRLGDLEWAQAVVPTPQGPLYLSIRREGQPGRVRITLDSPPGTKGEVVLPKGRTESRHIEVSRLGPRETGRARAGQSRPCAGPESNGADDVIVVGGLDAGQWLLETR